MKKQWISETQPLYDPHFWEIIQADLDPDELIIYDSLFPKLDNPVPNQLRMLAAYSYAAAEFKKAGENHDLANYLRRVMVYARNGLNIAAPVHVSYLELLLDIHHGWPPCFGFLDRSWQFGEDK